ncbi:hypothetical protein GQ43DRAFT_441434 [Delitschia confertaspora ATCC 74209]|uniref:Uncharacterized protein n=1 Tax=Delitschia confertaspora ATCC 74209 TaxID=1513339 RepID=A0A9P4JLS1_9PLEO|nr:hypothetical protein GQ43DRAFT_441434 [Delitschia confertaspora ATCC 74209]
MCFGQDGESLGTTNEFQAILREVELWRNSLENPAIFEIDVQDRRNVMYGEIGAEQRFTVRYQAYAGGIHMEVVMEVSAGANGVNMDSLIHQRMPAFVGDALETMVANMRLGLPNNVRRYPVASGEQLLKPVSLEPFKVRQVEEEKKKEERRRRGGGGGEGGAGESRRNDVGGGEGL